METLPIKLSIDPIYANQSIIGWILANDVRNEKGDPIEFTDHLYLFDIFLDQSPKLCILKCAQVGMSTAAILKNHFDAKHQKLDIIYTLPTDSDVKLFVGGKVNRIIENNPTMLHDVKDKDSIEQKQVGKSTIYFRGTWGERSTDMITADRLVHDEIDTSKQDNVRGLQARLQHSKHKQTHVFAHPSTPNNGVHQYWLVSDQKEWFIQCHMCKKWQTLSWDMSDPTKMSIDVEERRYRCKKCDATLNGHDRAYGHWMRKKDTEKAEWSGYHINLMMSVQTTAGEICDKWQDVIDGRQSMEFFYSRVLGLPFAGGGNSVSESEVFRCWTPDKNRFEGRLVIGVDTGLMLRYVIGNKQGLVGFGQMKAYSPDVVLGIALSDSLEYFLVKFPDSIMVIDQGGDIVGARQLQKKYPGRVYLCHYRRDRKTMELITWGEGDKSGGVQADRNRMIQLIADEVKIGGIQLFNGANAEAWHDYALHWTHIFRIWQKDSLGVDQYEWKRNDRDDWVHATVYWRIGIARFANTGTIVTSEDEVTPNSYLLNPDGSVSFNPDEMFRLPKWDQIEEEDDWR